ncbi:MAG: carbon-nitrogen hydrolase [Pseudobdellovibrionaceae bacterium]
MKIIAPPLTTSLSQSRPAFVAGVIQMKMVNEPASNLKKAIELIHQAADQGVQVVCLPELFLSPYFCQTLNPQFFNLAEPIPGPTTQALSEVAKTRQIVIVAPIYERVDSRLTYNSAAVIDADGSLLGVYRKMHIPHDPLFEEKYYFAPGDLGFKCFKTRYGQIGVLICWDQWFPEAARATALAGADIIFYPTAIGWHPAEKAEFGERQRQSWQLGQQAHGIHNRCFIAAANRIGHEELVGDGLEFFGHSFISGCYGEILTSLDHSVEGVIHTKVDPAWVEQNRRWWPYFRDRRTDAYQDLLKR